MFTKSFTKFMKEHELNIPRIEQASVRGTNPGKFLRRELLSSHVAKDMVDWYLQKGLAAYYAADYAKTIKFAYSFDKIKAVYMDVNCPSCMVSDEKSTIVGKFYNTNAFVLAYMENEKQRITARCMTFGKVHSSGFYGPEHMKLQAGLAELGYIQDGECSFNAQSRMVQINQMFPRWTSFEIPIINGEFAIPYIDGNCGCFIPYNRKQNSNGTHDCLFVPFWNGMTAKDVGELNVTVEELKQFVESVHRGDYLPYFIMQGTKHHIVKIPVEEMFSNLN